MNIFRHNWFTELSPDNDETNEKTTFNAPGNLKQFSPDSPEKGDAVINKGWQGQAFSLEVQDVLFQKKSKYQDVLIFKR